MNKLKLKYYLTALCGLWLLAGSCSDFLDMQPIDPYETDEDVFTKFSTVDQYRAGLWGYMPKEWLNGPIANTIDATLTGVPWLPASDELDASFNNTYKTMFDGTWNPASYCYDSYTTCYLGIRQCNYFLKNVDLCQDPNFTDVYRKSYKAEARFLRAYYYYYMIRMYGPIPLVGDEPVDPNAEFNIGRSKFMDCINYVCSELDAVAADLETEPLNNLQGKPTRGWALAIKARLLLQAASPLFNNPDHNSLYGSFLDADGQPYIPTDYDAEKWKRAADAALAVINLTDESGAKKYGLMTAYKTENVEGVPTQVIDPYESLREVYEVAWNKETIFGRNINTDHTYYQRCVPRGVGGDAWGGFGPTLQQVDAYAMNSGKYPITPVYTGANYSYTIDPTTGYTEEGFSTFTHPYDGYAQKTPNMFVNREPRFYMDILWDTQTYFFGIALAPVAPTASNSIKIQYYHDGNSGVGPSNNYSLTGLGLRKWNPRQNNLNSKVYVNNLAWPYVRLAEMYLDYTEAMIEYDPSSLDYTYWNELRARAGVPPILEVYPEAAGNKEMLRDLIRRERRVELAFEGDRFFSTRRWQIAEKTDAGYMYGFDIMQNSDADGSDFWKRTPTTRGRRYFNKKQYLWPIGQNEMDRNSLMVQTPFW